MLSTKGSTWLTSASLAPVTAVAKGIPWASVRTWCLVPNLARLVGSGPVALPPRGGRHRRTVGGLPVPPDPVFRVVAAQLVDPEPLPGPVADPLLEAAVAGRAGAEFHALQLQVFQVPVGAIIQKHREVEGPHFHPRLRPRIDVARYPPASPVPVFHRGLIHPAEAHRIAHRRIGGH